MRCITSALAATAILGAAAASAADRSGEVKVGSVARSYASHVPDGPAPGDGFPVVLVFHGGGGRGARIRRLTGLDRLADARGFVAVYPDGIDGHWNDGRSTIKNPQDDLGFVAALLDRIAASTPVDQRRVYATGLSNGALFAQRLGCDMPRRVSAITSVAGALPADLASRCRGGLPSRHC